MPYQTNKLSHVAVDFGPGHGAEFCRTCVYYRYDKVQPPECFLVVDIASGGWCKLWTGHDPAQADLGYERFRLNK